MVTEPTTMIGLGDAGAHVNSITNYTYPTYVLARLVRDKGWLSLTEGVRRLTSQPARTMGIEDRGVLAEGACADVCVIDIDGLDLGPTSVVHDLPSDATRLHRPATGYKAVLVNGDVAVLDDRPTTTRSRKAAASVTTTERAPSNLPVSSPPLTMIQKIMARASGQSDAPTGSVVVCEIDRVVLIDLQFRAFNSWRMPVRIADPARVAVILDHAVPAPSIADANAHEEARTFARAFGVSDFFDVGQHGICHQVIAEQGLARPGEMLVCADSHTCAGGAFNCAARGLGPLEILQVLCTGKTWFVVPETVRYTLTGSLGDDTSAKDLFLYLAAVHGEHNENRAIEFAGPGVATLAMHDRRVLATQGIELLAEFTLFPYDDITNRYLPTDGRVQRGGGV